MRNEIVIAAALVIAAIPSAAEDLDFARPGWYAGLGGSVGIYTELKAVNQGITVNEVGDDIESVGFNARGGYRFNPWVAAEVEFEFLPDSDAKNDGVKVAEVGTWAVTGNAKAFPFHGRFQPFALLGLGAVHQRIEDTLGIGIDDSQTVVAGRMGGGVDVYATGNIVISIDFTYVLPGEKLKAGGGDYVTFGWGAQYRF